MTKTPTGEIGDKQWAGESRGAFKYKASSSVRLCWFPSPVGVGIGVGVGFAGYRGVDQRMDLHQAITRANDYNSIYVWT